MTSNVTRTNNGKILVAVMAMAIIIAGAAIVMSDDQSDATATIGDISYSSFADAVEAIPEDGSDTVIKLTSVTEVTAGSYDLNGATIETDGHSLSITGSGVKISYGNIVGNVTILNNTTTTWDNIVFDHIKFSNPGYYSIDTRDADITVKDCVFEGQASSAIYFEPSKEDVNAVVTNCTFNGTYSEGAISFDNGIGASKTTVTIESTTQTSLSVGSARGNITIGGADPNIICRPNVSISEVYLDVNDKYSYGNDASKLTIASGIVSVDSVIGHGSVSVSEDATFNFVTSDVIIEGNGTTIIKADDISAGTVDISAGETAYVHVKTIDRNVEFNLGEGAQLVFNENVTISDGKTVTINGPTGNDVTGASVLIQDGVTINMDGATVALKENVRVNNYGSIEKGTIAVGEDATFYSATPVNTTFTGKGTIDLSDAMETLKISDKLASSAVLKPTQNVLVNGNLTINKGEYLVITGSLEVQEGVTITINEGGLLMVYGPSASATINGTIISKGEYTGDITGYVTGSAAGFTYEEGKSIDIAGTINAKKATAENVTTVEINGESNITGTVTIDSKAVALFGEATIAEGGVLNINGTYAGTILNQGTVNLNGSVSADASVAMNSTSAVLNVTALKGANTLEVTDEGLYLQTNDAGTRIEVGADDANVITLNNVKGVTVTEGYTYTTNDDGDRIVHNNLYIAGTLNAQDSKEPNFGKIGITSGVLSVSGELTIAKVEVIIGNGAEMNVTGTVYVTENDDYEFKGAGELTVTGLVRTVEDIDGLLSSDNLRDIAATLGEKMG